MQSEAPGAGTTPFHPKIAREVIAKLLARGEHFINLVKGVMLGASTSVYLNGAKTFGFSVERGVRQECPLAPLLFALATQPLMTLMKHNFQLWQLKGFKVGDSVFLDYSLFADDMEVFSDELFTFFQELRFVLAKYEISSDARLNLTQSSILYWGWAGLLTGWPSEVVL
ncbi:hypothetical protein AXG93_3253s1010 [Marchantia polymorpha subsp. ruderalis]|uniref:Uncharacterized protein n=1 Tax=Marchantia polymorpha subsp. ruderalis TaxID=1480154 RepID=A0A176WPF3_MARPO|nr:hypothetical protein AXG93_3253s1010 [Marchantia polymorpha subsp. ruderalis]